MKRIEIDGKFYRKRRGKLVLIPDEWVGNTVFEQTKRDRKLESLLKVKKRRKSRKALKAHKNNTLKTI